MVCSANSFTAFCYSLSNLHVYLLMNQKSCTFIEKSLLPCCKIRLVCEGLLNWYNTTGHRWEHSFGSISGILKRSKREGTRVREGSRGCLWAFQRGFALCNGPQQTGALRHVDTAALPLPVDLSTQERPSTSMRTPTWAPEENTHPNYFRKSVVHKKKKKTWQEHSLITIKSACSSGAHLIKKAGS